MDPYGTVYNIKGNGGLAIQLNNGKSTCLEHQNPMNWKPCGKSCCQGPDYSDRAAMKQGKTFIVAVGRGKGEMKRLNCEAPGGLFPVCWDNHHLASHQPSIHPGVHEFQS